MGIRVESEEIAKLLSDFLGRKWNENTPRYTKSKPYHPNTRINPHKH